MVDGWWVECEELVGFGWPTTNGGGGGGLMV